MPNDTSPEPVSMNRTLVRDTLKIRNPSKLFGVRGPDPSLEELIKSCPYLKFKTLHHKLSHSFRRRRFHFPRITILKDRTSLLPRPP
ncbi:hypothetical protein Lalb_Chr21g0313931 [Lupinus albus]|uniref:Uncharacterized protein n=1 Tax=Lupinus albus TaxID=3870 RepID=A0A6A4NK70_LUPAL|nr:hypothetical protein Lalb_Chr21g0313931 [Lupinus albus]